jgi:predicted metalloendopeptidase
MLRICQANAPALGAAFVLLVASAAGSELFSAPVGPGAPHGVDVAGMDPSVPPGDDFFRYANGSWLKTAEIPADRSSWGASAILFERASKETRELIEGASLGSPPAGSDARKIGNYFASYMDEAGIEAKGLSPLKAELTRIKAIKDRKGLSAYLGSRLRADVDALNSTNFYTDNLFGVWIAQGLEDPDHYVPYLLQGWLGMPDRDYYLADSERMAGLRAKYQAHIAAVLKLSGLAGADADAKAARIVALETAIAKAHGTREDSSDVLKANNPWTREEFAAKAPGLDWGAYFAAAGLGSEPRFILWQPGAVVGEAALVGSESLEIWKDYLAVHTVDHFAGVLPKAFVEERFAFYGTALSGTPKLADRWKRAVGSTSAALGEAIGRLFAEKYFPAESKAKVQAMVADLIAAFDKRVDNLTWMAPATKAEAKAKLKTLYVGVGYPETWVDYSALKIKRGDAFGNVWRAEVFELKRNLAKLGRPVDRKEWSMTPQTVNAVNMPMQNALNFPAAYLRPPYFDPEAPASSNYAAIGSTIGHEISHSFDDQGSQFDANGRLVNWWTPADFEHFKASSAALVAQYDAYQPFPDLHVNGKLTLSENIADVAGLSAAYDAYRLSLDGKPAPVVNGLTGDQQFFLSFGQKWRTKRREALSRQMIVTDSHAPAEYRALTVRNLDPWYSAFKVKPGQALYLAPDARVHIW